MGDRNRGDSGREKLDLRVVKTRSAIREAFLALLQTTEYSKITIAQIAREANINRKTFYLHYASVDDLFQQLLKEGLQEVQEAAFGFAGTGHSEKAVYDLTLFILEALDSKIDFEHMPVCNLPVSQFAQLAHGPLYEVISSQAALIEDAEDMADYRVACYLGSVLAAYTTWKSRRPSDKIEDVAAYVAHGAYSGFVDV